MQTIQGKIVKILPIQEGESVRGHWVKAGIVIEHGVGEQVRRAVFSVFGENRVQACSLLSIGTYVQIGYYPDSREYNGKWFTSLNCLSMDVVGQPKNDAPSSNSNASARNNSRYASNARAQQPTDVEYNDESCGNDDYTPF